MAKNIIFYKNWLSDCQRLKKVVLLCGVGYHSEPTIHSLNKKKKKKEKAEKLIFKQNSNNNFGFTA
jgi:hypothetical protein